MNIDAQRAFFAAEVCAVAGLDAPALQQALAKVPRERFVGPGPWQVVRTTSLPGEEPYRTTATTAPSEVYHNVLIGLDPSRNLNNGHPSSLAGWLHALEVTPGSRVVHIGCGVGYYTAVLAEMVGATGHVTAFEVDPGARASLADQPRVPAVGQGHPRRCLRSAGVRRCHFRECRLHSPPAPVARCVGRGRADGDSRSPLRSRECRQTSGGA